MTGRRWESIAIAKAPGNCGAGKFRALVFAALLVFGLANAVTAETTAGAGTVKSVGVTESTTVVGGMVIGAENDTVKLTFPSKGKLSYTVKVSETPPGAVITLGNAAFDSLPPKVAIGDGLLDSVEFTRVGPNALITLKLAKPAGVSATAADDSLMVVVGGEVVATSGQEEVPAAAEPASSSFAVTAAPGLLAFTMGSVPSKIDSFQLSDGMRMVVDLQDAKVPGGQYVADYPEGPVAKVAMRQNGENVRCVIEARGYGKFDGYSIAKTSDGFELRMPGVTAPAQVAAKSVPESSEPLLVAAAKSDKAMGGGMLTELGFHQDENRSYVDITLSKEAQYDISEATDKKVVLDIKNTSLSKRYQRALDASEFKGPVSIIAAYSRGPHTRIVVELKKPAVFKVEKTDVGIALAFDGGRGPDVAVAPPVEEEKIVLVTPEGKKVEPMAEASGETMEQAGFAKTKTGYTGQKISLDFVEADIRNILRILGEISNLNIVAGSEVSGKMTIRLVDIPWDQALDVILKAKGLDKEIDGNVMRIVAAERLAAERAAKVAAEVAEVKAKEDTTPLASDIIPVSYANAKDILENIKPVMSKRGSVSIDNRTNMILLRDLPENIELAKSMVANLDTPTPQVLIEARIVEVSSSYTKDLGVQWGGLFTADSAHGNAPTNGFPNSIGISGDTGLSNYAVNFPASAGSGGGVGSALSLSLGSINDIFGLDLRLSAMESTGKGRVVSSPRVSTMDNKPAEISQGISIPFTTATQEKIQTQSIDYLLKLMVTPHVTSDNSIVLKIDLKKDSPSTTFVAVDSATPAKETRSATTEVLVKDGETTVIGGIITDSNSQTNRGVPWFHNIPIIGWLFESNYNRVDKTELIIFITPRVIRLDAAKIAK